MNVSVVKIGYYDYVVDVDFVAALLTAAAEGKIKTCTKNYIDSVYKVTVGKPIDIAVELLETVTTRDAELADLKAKLKKLEDSNG